MPFNINKAKPMKQLVNPIARQALFRPISEYYLFCLHMKPTGLLFFFLLILNVHLANAQDINLAMGKPSLSSSVESDAYRSEFAFDGNMGTRWSSAFADSQWLQLDLTKTSNISKIILHWEAAFGKRYEIQFSTDGSKWTVGHRQDNGRGEEEVLQFSNQQARFIRLYGLERATEYGFSLFEMEVYGPGDSSDASLRSILINGNEWPLFSRNRYEYDYILPAGTQAIPSLGIATSHPAATYQIEHPLTLPGRSRITSISPDKSDTLIYRIRWIPSTYELLWADEFNNDGKVYLEGKINAVDSSKWFHQTILPNGGSWYNGEVQHYTDRTANAYVSDGSLKIVAKRERLTQEGETKQFTSARLNSKSAFPVSRAYGKIEFRAKIPEGAGTWPAIWMLGQNIKEKGAYWETQGYGTVDWPACGEIDIMEHWGDNQNYITSALHTPSSFGSTENKGGQRIPTASSAFHLYSLEWSPETMTFLVDGKAHYTYAPDIRDERTWPFDVPQYLLLNIAIEGDIDANGPVFQQAQMEIDYIRVYQQQLASVSMPAHRHLLRVFPNPTQLNLTFEADDLISEIRIVDFAGREQHRVHPRAKQFVLDHQLQRGIYLANVCINSQWQQHKFMVE